MCVQLNLAVFYCMLINTSAAASNVYVVTMDGWGVSYSNKTVSTSGIDM